MDVICLESEALYTLIDTVVDRIKEERNITDNRWISQEKAKDKLGIKSDTTMQKFRDKRRIGFSQPEKKLIFYDRDSIDAYIEKHYIPPL